MKKKHCSSCGRSGHNSRTCPVGEKHGKHKTHGSISESAARHIDAIEKHVKALKKKL